MAVLTEVLAAVKTRVVALALTDIPDEHVVALTAGDAEGGDGPNVPGYPAVFIFPAANEREAGGTNARDSWVYPIAIVLVAIENRNQTAHRDRNFTWRENIRRRFHQQRLPGVTGGVAWKCEVKPGTPVDLPRWAVGEHAQIMVVDVFVLESRS